MLSFTIFSLTIAAAAINPQHALPTPVTVPGGGMTKAQFVERVREMFDRLDIKKKGYLTRADVSMVFSDASGQSKGLTLPFFVHPARFAIVDLNKDGRITSDEYARFSSWVYDQSSDEKTGTVTLSDRSAYEKFVSAVERGPTGSH